MGDRLDAVPKPVCAIVDPHVAAPATPAKLGFFGAVRLKAEAEARHQRSKLIANI